MEATSGRKYVEQDGAIYCDRAGCPGSTGLRCQRTNVPICPQCAVMTPVGYISKDAAKSHADKFYNIAPTDYVIAATVAFVVTTLGGLGLLFFFGRFWLILIVAAMPLGGGVAELVWRAIRYKRGRRTQQVVAGAMIAATFVLFIFGFIWGLMLGGIATAAAVSRFEVALRA